MKKKEQAIERENKIEKATEQERRESAVLTREEILQRLRECWEELAPQKGRLTEAGKEFIESNFALARIWCEVQSSEDVKETESAIGFHFDEEDVAYSEGDFPEEDEKILG